MTQRNKYLLFICVIGSLISNAQENTWASIPAPIPIQEKIQSPWDEALDLDSLALWRNRNGENLILGTSKKQHKILVYNASTGALQREIGVKGTGQGEFKRPNGIAIYGNLAFVVERDNHRIQVLLMPEGKSVAAFGQEDLRLPYGLTLIPEAKEEDPVQNFTLYVTDDYHNPDGSIPEDSELGKRVHQYRFSWKNGKSNATFLRSFGETKGDGVLKKVESIMVDPENNRLMIADENQKNIKIYDLQGTYTGKTMGEGYFQGDAEGIALYRCPGGKGYWIFTDQNLAAEENKFVIFDRVTLQPLGSFRGFTTSNTDGIFLAQKGFKGFSNGALFALHNDGGFTAFRWKDIAQALSLKTCPLN